MRGQRQLFPWGDVFKVGTSGEGFRVSAGVGFVLVGFAKFLTLDADWLSDLAAVRIRKDFQTDECFVP